MRTLSLLAALALALPAAAQDVSPSEALGAIWTEAQVGAEAAADGIDDALDDDSLAVGAASEARAESFRRTLVVASHAAAGSAGMLKAAVQMQIAIAEPEQQAATEASLAEPVMALYYALAAVVDEAAGVAESAEPPDAETRAAWRARAAFVRRALAFVRDTRGSE